MTLPNFEMFSEQLTAEDFNGILDNFSNTKLYQTYKEYFQSPDSDMMLYKRLLMYGYINKFIQIKDEKTLRNY